MSYLAKTVFGYWNFDEAIEAKRIEKENCSLESAFDALKTELDFYNNDTANKWKQNWKASKTKINLKQRNKLIRYSDYEKKLPCSITTNLG
jgi:hypothetical protein